MTRRVQAFKAHYNTYYNGQLAFKDGELAQETGNKDNFTDVIPFYMTGNKTTVTLGKSDFDRAVEKCQKTIKQHSITKRPEWKGNKAQTPKDKIWLNQKEYNPFLYKAWFLLGESQFRKGEYMEAASTFAYIQHIYFSDPDIIAKARLLEAKCYAELEWYYDSEDLLNKTERDSFPTNLKSLKAAVEANIFVRQKQYEEAIPNLLLAVKKEKRSLQKTRIYYLLGQLYHRTGNDVSAYKYYSKVIKRNPPYELEFNARIHRTECITNGQLKQIRYLQSMARSEKNKDYLDQVYYAIGNVYLSMGDTIGAINSYETGVEKSTRNGIEKGVLLLHLSRLYWQTEKFVRCQKTYSDALSLFDKDMDDYAEIYERSKILDDLLPYASAVELQDSLQRLAKMSPQQREKVIEKIIEELKKKEKEEERKAAESEEAAKSASTNTRNNKTNNGRANNNTNANNSQKSVWYFYNATTVEAGKKEFANKWGKRKLADDWRRSNVTVLSDYNAEEQTDSVSADSTQRKDMQAESSPKDKKADKKRQKEEEKANDPHNVEYYLKDIPLTEEQMDESNSSLVDGLYGSAIIYKDEMENLPLAKRTFDRILSDFPDFESKDEVYYNLFQLYSRMNDSLTAEDYRQKLLTEYPQNEHAKLIADPLFLYKGKYGKHIEDSIYTEAYNDFCQGNFRSVVEKNEYASREYPNGDNRARFLFITAMSKLELGEREEFLTAMRDIVENYPKSTISELAGMYVKGLKEGRLLASGKFEMGSIWERRHGVGEEGDSLAVDTAFSKEKNNDWVFAIAYERDSVDENQLLFEIAKYNFTNFTVRNFDIATDKGDGIDMLQVRTFNNYDEAYIYLHRLMNNEEMAYKLGGLKCFIISEDNLKLLMKGFSFADYFEFYDENFDRLGHLQVDDDTLDSTDEIINYDEQEEEYYEEEEEEENFIF